MNVICLYIQFHYLKRFLVPTENIDLLLTIFTNLILEYPETILRAKYTVVLALI